MPDNVSSGSVPVRLHPHARLRLPERGAADTEVIATVRTGRPFAAKLGRTGFRRTFPYNAEWRGIHYTYKRIEAFAVREDDGWLVITVIVKYF